MQQISCNRGSLNNTGGQIIKTERSSIISPNSNLIINEKSLTTTNQRQRFRDPYWNENVSNHTINNTNNKTEVIQLNEKNDCKWSEWLQWSDCLPLTLNMKCDAEGERTRSRACSCR